jgi:hypothetical protein
VTINTKSPLRDDPLRLPGQSLDEQIQDLYTFLFALTVAVTIPQLVAAHRRQRNLRLGRDGKRAVGQTLERLRRQGRPLVEDPIMTPRPGRAPPQGGRFRAGRHGRNATGTCPCWWTGAASCMCWLPIPHRRCSTARRLQRPAQPRRDPLLGDGFPVVSSDHHLVWLDLRLTGAW